MRSPKKPLIVFASFILCLSAFIIILKDIKIPAFSLLKSKSQSHQEVKPKVSYNIINNKITLKYRDLDIFFEDCCSVILKNVKSKEENGQTRIEGKATFPFSADFRAKMNLWKNDDKVKIEISEVTLGKVESPEGLQNKLQDLIQKKLDENINEKYKVKDVKITHEGIEITLK